MKYSRIIPAVALLFTVSFLLAPDSYLATAQGATPVLSNIPNLTPTTGTPFTYQVVATDADGDTLTFRLYGGTSAGNVEHSFLGTDVRTNSPRPHDDSLRINSATGLITWDNPNQNLGETNYFAVRVTDGDNTGDSVASQSFQITSGTALQPASPPTPPIMGTIPSLITTIGQPYVFNVGAITTDLNLDTLTFTTHPKTDHFVNI